MFDGKMTSHQKFKLSEVIEKASIKIEINFMKYSACRLTENYYADFD